MSSPSSHPRAELCLAIAVAAIVGTMIVPLPPWLLDGLIALNIALALTLLVAALTARNALGVATFPTLLLVTTLLRLSLNVSSTRLALVNAHAGEVIQAFGEFVIQGDYVAGAVIFAILSIVQFLVIAKGAERVAEVSARFTLDAMPGKQMAIDADLRAGCIDHRTASARRRALERESQMFGAMDGAMKFVKGDAIAGLLIVAINALGGLIIGIAFKGMAAGEAARTFVLLAIGDGLVSQIPALCIAVAAGLLSTRVAGEDERTSLGEEIWDQFLARPRALAIVAGLVTVVGLIPTMPKLPFFAVATACASASLWIVRRSGGAQAAGATAESAGGEEHPVGGASTKGPHSNAAGVAPLCLDLDPSWRERLERDGDRLTSEALPSLREALYFETGIRFPAVQVRLAAPGARGAWAVLVDEIPSARGALDPDLQYVVAAPDDIAFLAIRARPVEDPCTGRIIAAIDASDRERAQRAGFEVRGALDQLLASLALVLRRFAGSFLGVQEVQALLEAMEKSHPALVREATQRVPAWLQAEIFRRLVDEGVPIRNLRAILEALAESAGEADPLALSERCRRALRRQLTHRFAPEGTLCALLADPEVEELLRESAQATPGDLSLSPDDAAAILDGVRQAIGPSDEAVILAAPDVRRYLRKLCEGAFPKVAVLTYAELEPSVQVHPVGKILAHRRVAA